MGLLAASKHNVRISRNNLCSSFVDSFLIFLVKFALLVMTTAELVPNLPRFEIIVSSSSNKDSLERFSFLLSTATANVASRISEAFSIFLSTINFATRRFKDCNCFVIKSSSEPWLMRKLVMFEEMMSKWFSVTAALPSISDMWMRRWSFVSWGSSLKWQMTMNSFVRSGRS